MTYNGTLTRIGVIGDTITPIVQETSCTLNFTSNFVDTAQDGRADGNIPQRKGWDAKGEAILSEESFILIYNAIKSGQKVQLFIATPLFTLAGNAIFTKLSFQSSGNSKIRMSFAAQGDGQPLIS